MFTFAFPYLFLILPLPFLFIKFWKKPITINTVILKVPFIDKMITNHKKNSLSLYNKNYHKIVLMVLIWFLLLLAAANPIWLGSPLAINLQSRNIMLAVDISQSMEIPDLKKNNQQLNRLQVLKTVAKDFISKRHGDRLGLILFGSKAFLQTPLTYDRNTVEAMLEDATIGLAGTYTAIGDAIALAVKKLSIENFKSRILILLTDGANNSGTIDPLKAATLAKENQIKIYTVGIGATELEIANLFGRQVINPSADLDEPMLKEIANSTNGRYFRAKDEHALEDILDSINKLEPVFSNQNELRPITSLFYWPLSFAFFLTLVLLAPLSKQREQS